MLTELLNDKPQCASEAGSACALVWKATGQPWLAASSDVLVVKPLRILLIIVLCLLIRGLVNRAIKRFTRTRARNETPTILKPLKERVPNLMSDADAEELMGSRRRARAQTIGSVLRSMVSWLIYAIMIMLVLAELNVNLGPVLASAGVAGVALGFGAQSLVKDILSGIFMLMEDQYGVGDLVDLGEAIGTVEVVGLRVTTLRDLYGTLWYVRNGEILRVGNKSQSFANVVIDLPLGPTVDVEAATQVITQACEEMNEASEWSDAILEAPDVQGVVDMNMDATVFRVLLKVDAEQQWAIGRDLRRRISHALRQAGISNQLTAGRVFVPRGNQQNPT